ncbi:unnamed protein product [Durusdinium trenchii]|uniref:RING-type domain-containing protein n=1 Tax=Durusdinium trenchii TaxID=1381693 RepID=A0ABP0MVV4_9DINO
MVLWRSTSTARAVFLRGRAARKRQILRTRRRRSSRESEDHGAVPGLCEPSRQSSASTSSEEETWPLRPREADLGDFLLPCGLYQEQVVELMYRPLTPEDYELLKSLDDALPNRSTAEKSHVAALLSSASADPLCALGEDCGVCLDPVDSAGGQITRLPCDHAFHPACIEKWLTKFKNSCPLCGAAPA